MEVGEGKVRLPLSNLSEMLKSMVLLFATGRRKLLMQQTEIQV